MAEIRVGGVTFAVTVRDNLGVVDLVAEGRAPITLCENMPGSGVIEGGRVPGATQAYIARYLEREAQALEEARRATAQQMWGEYIGGWREAGSTDVADEAAFARALGTAALSLNLEPDGQVSMAELHWADRDLFMGHSIFTSVFDPEVWGGFDATLFG